MSCKACGCPENQPCQCLTCEAVRPSQIRPLAWVQGKDVNNCLAFETFADFSIRITDVVEAALCAATPSPIAPAFVLGRDVNGNCPVFFTPAQLLAGSLAVLDTPSIDLTFAAGVLSANIVDQYVRNLFSVIDTTYVNMTYNPLTGEFSAVVDPFAIVNAALCSILASQPFSSFVYGVTQLAGADCAKHVIPAQLLIYDQLTGTLSITSGNSVIIPDLHIVNFTIVGNIATIVRNDGAIFQQPIPMTLDINVASFTLSGGILTITETDGSVHTITLPQDCCPVSFLVSGGNLILTLSNGTVFTVPLPPDVHIANISVAGNILTITETDGGVFTAVMPQYNVTSADGSVTVVTTLGPGNLTSFDLSINFPPPSAIVCAQVVACLIEGQNIDIQPTGVVSAGFLRNDGGDCYTWVNQDGFNLYSFCLPSACAQLAVAPLGAPVGPGGSVFVLDPSTCQQRLVTIPAAAVPFNLCISLAALPAGAPVGPGGSIVVLDPNTCERRLVTIPPAFDLCVSLAALPAGAPIPPGGVMRFVDPITCQMRLYNTPVAFDLCAGIAALPAGPILLPGSVVTIIDATTCERRVFPVPFTDVCAVLAGRPVGPPVGGGQSVTVLDPTTCTMRVVTIPAGSGPFDLCAGLSALAGPSSVNIINTQFVTVDGAGNCARQIITAAAPCSTPTRIIGSTAPGAVVSFEWSALEQRTTEVFASQPPVGVVYPGAALTIGAIAQALAAGVNNTHLCRSMSYQTNLRSGRTQIGFPFGQIYQAIGKNIALAGPLVGTGNVYLSSDNRIVGGVLLNYVLPADTWNIAGNLPPGGAAAWTMNLAPENAGALANAPAASGQFFTAHITILAVQN